MAFQFVLWRCFWFSGILAWRPFVLELARQLRPRLKEKDSYIMLVFPFCCICHCINFWYLRQFHSKLSAAHSRLFLMHPGHPKRSNMAKAWADGSGVVGQEKLQHQKLNPGFFLFCLLPATVLAFPLLSFPIVN